MISPFTLSKLKSIVGHENYFDSPEQKIAYSYDGTPLLSQLPVAIVRPQTKEDIGSIIQLANNNRFAVVPRGSGTGLSGGSIPTEDSIVILTNHWNKILEVDENNLTVWVEPGVITLNFNQRLNRLIYSIRRIRGVRQFLRSVEMSQRMPVDYAD